MGNLLARHQNRASEELDAAGSGNAYFYPPKIGNYFSSHFIMGGERFESCQPEAYLFGENMDLNFLGGKPTPFPYSAPMPHEPTRTLRALINIRKESLRFVKVPIEVSAKTNEDNTHSYQDADSCGQHQVPLELQKDKLKYNIEFIFDTDVKCAITIYYMCSEEITPSGIVYTPRDTSKNSETFTFKRGANQHFIQALHVFDPLVFDEDDLMYRAFDEHGNFDQTVPFPVVIQCLAEEGGEPRQSHTLIAVVERNSDGSFSIKPFKQKVFIDGLCYLFQEIYGIENKSVAVKRASDNGHMSPDEDGDDNGSECVICMSDSRDTLILPCRHLCLCYACADSLRYQANNCPICRSPFRALLQLKAVRRSMELNRASSALPPNSALLVPHNQSHRQHHVLCASANDLVDIPPGYEAVSLVETLNGTRHVSHYSSHGMYRFRRISDNDSAIATPIENGKFKVAKRTWDCTGDGTSTSPPGTESREPNTEEKWTGSQSSQGQYIISDLSTESSTSSNVSEAVTNQSLQEKVGLLASDKDESEMELQRRVSLADQRELSSLQRPESHQFRTKPKNAFPLVSASVPALCASNVATEQKTVAETDLNCCPLQGCEETVVQDKRLCSVDALSSPQSRIPMKKLFSSLPNVKAGQNGEDVNLTPVCD